LKKIGLNSVKDTIRASIHLKVSGQKPLKLCSLKSMGGIQMKIIITRITSVAIVKAKDWFKTLLNKTFLDIRLDDYVVCKWSDFHDGEKSNIEGKTTIAICRELNDAILIYASKIK